MGGNSQYDLQLDIDKKALQNAAPYAGAIGSVLISLTQ